MKKTTNDIKLYILRVLYLLLPSVYILIRMHIIAIESVDINILGQIEWFDLIDEILVATLTMPLYSLLKPEIGKRYSGFAMILCIVIYALFASLVFINISSITAYMQAERASQYLSLQMISMMVSFVSTLMILLFTLYSEINFFAIILCTRLALQVLLDIILIPRYLELGAVYSEIATNLIISLITIILARSHNYFRWDVPDRAFLCGWIWKICCSGLQIFMDNFIYAVMVCKMVNEVAQTGRYWVANNFIWGWLLIPVSCYGEIIRKNKSDMPAKKSTWICVGLIVLFWIVSAPCWGWFMEYAMASDRTIISDIVLPLMPFYLFYLLSVVIDSWFISVGKLWCNTINSVIVNIVYYGIVYILFRHGVFEPSMGFVIGMFGFGMVVHFLVAVGMYEGIRILRDDYRSPFISWI